MGRCRRSLELVVDLLSLARIRFDIVLRPQPEPSVLALPADVREAQEVEGLRLADSPGLLVAGRVAPELDQPGLVGMQLQSELREPSAKVSQEPLGVTSMLEPDDEVIGRLVTIMSPRASRFLHCRTQRSNT